MPAEGRSNHRLQRTPESLLVLRGGLSGGAAEPERYALGGVNVTPCK